LYKQNLFFLFLLIFILSCSNKLENNKKIKNNIIPKSSIEFAKGFDILQFTDFKKIVIKSQGKNVYDYLLLNKNKPIPKNVHYDQLIRTPIKKIVVTSTTHIPMLEKLNEEKSLVGFPGLHLISSKKTRKLIASKKIVELGNVQNMNTESLLDLNPDVVVSFSINKTSKLNKTIQNAGIPIIVNGDWLEKTPLGRAEWIKLFATLYNKDSLANSIFNHIKFAYDSIKKIAQSVKVKPTVFSGALFQDSWIMPGGKSFFAQYLSDANSNYLWSDNTNTGSTLLSFENVFEKAQHAQFWIAPSYYTSYSQMLEENIHYKKFDAFKNRQVYTFALKKGETGGIEFYEKATMQPQVVLKDLIKIVHPNLLDWVL